MSDRQSPTESTEGVHCSLCTLHRLGSSVNPCVLSLAYSSVKDLTKMPLGSKSNATYSSLVPIMEIGYVLKKELMETTLISN